MSRTHPRAAFSLVELLAVIVVIAIIMGIVMPSLSGLGRGPALVAAGNTVNNLVGLARQHAMSRNTLTALVLLANQGTETDYRALTVFEYKPGIRLDADRRVADASRGITVDWPSEERNEAVF